MLKDSNDAIMVDNFRPIQPLNNRIVYSSFKVSAEPPKPTTEPTTKPTTEPTTKPTTEATAMGPTADATAVSLTAAPFLLMLVAALFKH